MSSPPVFADDSDDERALCLVSNEQWTVILYREAFEEGDRLLSELDDWPVVLEVVIADSDVWGYDLIEAGELTASFNSNPHYFGDNEQKLPLNGDPHRLCQVLGLSGRENEIHRLQRRRFLFADFPCQSFCRLIGASAGSLHFNDINVQNRTQKSRRIGDWQVELMFFERRSRSGSETAGPVLHSLVVREFETRRAEPPSVDPELVRNLNRQVQIISLLFKPLGWLAAGLGPLIRWWFKRQLHQPKGGRTGDPFLDALTAGSSAAFSRQNDWLVNSYYGVRIKAPAASADTSELWFTMPNEIFRFVAGEMTLSATAVRPERLRDHFVLRDGASLVAEESFFAQRLPARYLAVRIVEREQVRFNEHWFVEFDRFVARVTYSSAQEPRSETAKSVRAVIETFEQIPTG